jgi:hypothetical protein
MAPTADHHRSIDVASQRHKLPLKPSSDHKSKSPTESGAFTNAVDRGLVKFRQSDDLVGEAKILDSANRNRLVVVEVERVRRRAGVDVDLGHI